MSRFAAVKIIAQKDNPLEAIKGFPLKDALEEAIVLMNVGDQKCS